MASTQKDPSNQLGYFEKIRILIINPSIRSTRQMKTQIDTTQRRKKKSIKIR